MEHQTASAAPAEPFRVLLRRTRRNLDITQGQLGARLGVGQPAVSAWEKGRAYPAMSVMEPLARELQLDLESLMAVLVAERSNAEVTA